MRVSHEFSTSGAKNQKYLKPNSVFGMETNFLIVFVCFVCVYDLRWQNVDGFCYYSTITLNESEKPNQIKRKKCNNNARK